MTLSGPLHPVLDPPGTTANALELAPDRTVRSSRVLEHPVLREEPLCVSYTHCGDAMLDAVTGWSDPESLPPTATSWLPAEAGAATHTDATGTATHSNPLV